MNSIKSKAHFFNNPVRLIVFSFLFLILIGSVLLSLPISSKSGQFSSYINSLFVAASSTCITGLTVYDIHSHYTFWGQLIIFFLIQIGGLSLISFSTFLTLSIKHRLGLKNLKLAKEYASTDSIMNIPKLFKLIVLSTISIELIGALIFSIRFIPKFGVAEGIWVSVFTSVSSFCGAGFDIFSRAVPSTNLSDFNNDPLIIYTVCVLVIIGGLGFLVYSDLLRTRFKISKLTFHSKLVLLFSAVLVVLGTVIFFVFENNNTATIAGMSLFEKFNASLMQSVTTRTCGYFSVPINKLFTETKLFMIFFMFIGTAPASTGGGIKITTFLVLFFTVISVIKGRNDTYLFGRTVDKKTVYKSFAIFALAFLLIIIVTFIIVIFDPEVSAINALFEATSAFGTVGLSCGITDSLHNISKVAIIITMFCGRVGPVSMGYIFTSKNLANTSQVISPNAKIIVG